MVIANFMIKNPRFSPYWNNVLKFAKIKPNKKNKWKKNIKN